MLELFDYVTLVRMNDFIGSKRRINRGRCVKVLARVVKFSVLDMFSTSLGDISHTRNLKDIVIKIVFLQANYNIHYTIPQSTFYNRIVNNMFLLYKLPFCCILSIKQTP